MTLSGLMNEWASIQTLQLKLIRKHNPLNPNKLLQMHKLKGIHRGVTVVQAILLTLGLFLNVIQMS